MGDKALHENIARLGYSLLWIESGILSEHKLAEQVSHFKTGEDPNTEHYRYNAFCEFVQRQTSIDPTLFRQIIQVLKQDSDLAMSNSAAMYLLKRQQLLSDDQFDEVVTLLGTTNGSAQRTIERIRESRLQ